MTGATAFTPPPNMAYSLIAQVTCESANSAFYTALTRLCWRDRRLGNAIQSVRAGGDGKTLVIESTALPYSKLFGIARLVLITGAAFDRISLNGRSIEIQLLVDLCPAIAGRTGDYDRLSNVEQREQIGRRLQAILSYEKRNATLFVVSTDGVYLDVYIRDGMESRIPAEQMVGRSLSEVLAPHPKGLEAAFFLTTQIRAAYEEGKQRTVEYGIWERRYSADIVPVLGSNEVFLVCTLT